MIHLLYISELFQSYTLLSINKLIFIKALLMIRIDFYFLTLIQTIYFDMVEYLGILDHVLS